MLYPCFIHALSMPLVWGGIIALPRSGQVIPPPSCGHLPGERYPLRPDAYGQGTSPEGRIASAFPDVLVLIFFGSKVPKHAQSRKWVFRGLSSCLQIKHYNYMARQKGIVKLEGSIGDMSFYKTADGYLAREKVGIDKERIKNDPAFQRTRENGSEFGRGGRAGRVMRTAFRLLLQNAADKKVTSRLTREMIRVIQTDPINVRGERTVTAGDQSLLLGFDFNINSQLTASLFAPYTIAADRVSGTMQVNFPEFIPGNTIVGPQGATHVKVVSAGAAIDFEAETSEVSVAKSNNIVLGSELQEAIELNHALPANSPGSLFLVLGLEFVQSVNGVDYPLKSGGFNPLTIVAIDQPELPEAE